MYFVWFTAMNAYKFIEILVDAYLLWTYLSASG